MQSNASVAKASRGRALQLGCVAVAAVLFLSRLGALDLWAPDEPRYAAIAEELRSGRHGAGGAALLHLNDAPYTQKPPLYFWLAALAGARDGAVSETAARLPSALAGIAVVALTVWFGGRLFGRETGALAGLLLLSTFEFAHRARRVQLDILLVLFEWLALAVFWRMDSAHTAGAPRKRVDLALLHAAIGLAVLTKGPVGALLPALAIAGWLAWERRLGAARGLLPAWGLALSLGPALVWLAIATALAPDGFFGAAVGTNLFGRYFAGTSHARPFYYYVYHFPLCFLPWTLLWPWVWRRARSLLAPAAPLDAAGLERARAWRFLLAPIAAHLVFFSVSTGKRGLYLLPAFPPLALLCADAALALLARRASGDGSTALSPDRSGAARRLVVAALGVAALELAVFTLGFPLADAQKSPRPIAAAAAALTAPDEPIGLARKRGLIGGLTYYGARRVVPLQEAEDVRAFVERGGRVIVIPEKNLEALTGDVEVRVEAALREGRRRVLVLTATARGDVRAPDTTEDEDVGR